MATFDIRKLSLTIGTHIVSDFAAGSTVEVTADDDAYTTTPDANSNSNRYSKNNNNYTMTLPLDQASPSNDVLSGFFALDKLNNSGSFPLVMKDDNGTTLVSCLTAYIERPADASFGLEAVDKVWTIKLTEANYFVGGFGQ